MCRNAIGLYDVQSKRRTIGLPLRQQKAGMNQSFQPDPIEQKIVDLLPLLVTLGRTRDASAIPESKLPNPWDFGVFWKKWDRVVEGWDAAQIADLIKGLTYFEKAYERGFGSVPPAASVFRVYSSRVDEKESDDLAEWVLANTVNEYTPYGTYNHRARSLAELQAREDARRTWKQATAAHERARSEDAKIQRRAQATERLPNAIRRKDAKAVAALVAKGADPDAVGANGQNAREIAKTLGVESWLSGEMTGGP